MLLFFIVLMPLPSTSLLNILGTEIKLKWIVAENGEGKGGGKDSCFLHILHIFLKVKSFLFSISFSKHYRNFFFSHVRCLLIYNPLSKMFLAVSDTQRNFQPTECFEKSTRDQRWKSESKSFSG